MIRRPHWRTLLDPRDPDYMDAEDDAEGDADEDDLDATDLDRAASEAENNWRPTA